MKKILAFLLVLSISLLAVSCDPFANITTEAPVTEVTTNIPTTIGEDTTIETTIETTTVLVETTESTTIETTQEEVTTTDPIGPIYPTDLSLIQDHIEYPGIPTVGNPKILVFVVEFPGEEIQSETEVLNDMEIAFNGADSEIEWESLNSYYLKSSYGNLDLTADIYGVYTADYSSTYYETEYYEYYSDSDLVYEIVDYYSSQIDYSDYDYDSDGMIDGIYIVYDHPYDYDSEIWWAYQTIYMYNGDIYNGVEPLNFTWISLDFFYDSEDPIDARTVIHETGHMMGLEDYYDYYEYDIYDNSGGLDSVDMMDSSLGDHNAFSKLMLGWINPIVIDKSMSIDIEPFLEAGEVILLIDDWNDTIFDEYILISYYTPTGLNEEDKYYLLSEPGIIMYHVDAILGNNYSEYYPSDYTYNNTDTEFMLIKIIEKSIQSETYVMNDDLFLMGDNFGEIIYSDYMWHDNTSVNISIDITYLDNTKASIDIQFNE